MALRAVHPCLRRIPGPRFASHDAPQFNEPSGYLFGEKVSYDGTFRVDIDEHFPLYLAFAAWTETCEGGLGEHLVLGNVWVHGVCSSHVVLQA